MCELCFATGRTEEFPYAAGFSCDDGNQTSSNAEADGTAVSSAPLPVFTNDQIAEQLTQETSNGSPIAFDAGPGDTITVDITGLTNDGKFLATNALEAWSNVTGLNSRLCRAERRLPSMTRIPVPMPTIPGGATAT